MADIIGLAASAAGGGVFGLLGTVIGRIAGFFERRQENVQERARWTHEAAVIELQMKVRASELAGQESLAQTSGAWEGLAASMAAEASIGESYRWVNAVRALTRPLLTLLLWLITGLVYLGAAAEAKSGIVETTTFAATAATLWWFGDRGNRREVR
ncbi:MAG: hypothetical protein RLO80_12655 [Hyphomonas sp.]